MQIIDDQGNLFGRVNIVDALVVVLIAAIVIAGIALLLPSDDPEQERYVTVDLGEQSTSLVERLSTGSNLTVEDTQHNLTITDMYVTTAGPDQGGEPRVILRGQLDVTTDSETNSLQVDDQRLQLGTELSLTGADYTASGTVEEIDQQGTGLSTDTRTVTVETETSATLAEQIEADTDIALGGHPVATITDVDTVSQDPDRQRLRMNVDLRTITLDGTTRYAGQPLRPGTQLSLTGDTFAVSGEVTRLVPTTPPEETRTMTLDFGTQSTTLLDQVAVGDTMEVGEGQELVIEDIYVSPAGDNEGRLVAAVSVIGQSVERPGREDPVFEFAGERPRVGDQLTVDTGDYTLSGDIDRIHTGEPQVAVNQTPVVLETTLDRSVTGAVTPGDVFTVGTHSVATVESVQPYPVGDNTDRVFLGVNLSTRIVDGAPRFAGSGLSIGNNLQLSADTYTIDGTVRQRDTTTERGDLTNTTVEMKLENIDPDMAASLDVGMTETIRGETLAELTEVNRSPAVIVTESEDGELRREEHPENKDVRMTVSLQTRNLAEGSVRFHGTNLREGQSYTLDLGPVLVEPTVTEIQGAEAESTDKPHPQRANPSG